MSQVSPPMIPLTAKEYRLLHMLVSSVNHDISEQGINVIELRAKLRYGMEREESRELVNRNPV